MNVRRIGFVLTLLAAGAAPAASQDVDMRGAWIADEGGRTCQVQLAGPSMFGSFGASSFGCASNLRSLTGYRISGRDMTLTGIGNQELGRLQLRNGQLVGSVGGTRVTLSRAGANAAPVMRAQDDRREERRCVWRFDANRCAQPDELRVPAPGSTVQVVNLLHLRAEPSFQSASLGGMPPRTCLPVRECHVNAETLFCATEWQGRQGWIGKVTPLKNLGFADGCR